MYLLENCLRVFKILYFYLNIVATYVLRILRTPLLGAERTQRDGGNEKSFALKRRGAERYKRRMEPAREMGSWPFSVSFSPPSRAQGVSSFMDFFYRCAGGP